MDFITITILILAALKSTAAKPVSYVKDNGAAIPLTRHSLANTGRKSVNLDAVHLHLESLRYKILDDLSNYERNTGKAYPFAVKGKKSRKRSGGLPLKMQEGILWYGELSIGSSAEVFTVAIDTGSSDMFVPKISCSTCEGHKMWDPHSSTTAKPLGEPFNIKYSDGDIASGDQYTDYVTIAGMTAYPQTFGAATQYSPGFKKEEFEPDGYLGMAFPSLSKCRGEPLFATLIKNKRVINPTFSFKLTPSGGEMYIGGANSSLYTGNIAYSRVTEPLVYWQVIMEEIHLGKKLLENILAVIDTGSNYIVGDPDRVAALYEGSGARIHEEMGEIYYVFPCGELPRVALTFGGMTFEIDPKFLDIGAVDDDEIECFSGIIAADLPVSYWHIGAVFLQNVYTVFDYGALQVGFARLA